MKKIFTKGLSIASAIILFISVSLSAQAQFTRTDVETGGLYTALAKDASNNIYVTRVKSGTNGAVYEVVKYIGGTGAPVIIYTKLTHTVSEFPWGLAVNSGGDIFVSTDFTSLGGAIIKLTYNSGSNIYTPSTYLSGNYYTALAIDAADNLYTTQYDSPSGHYRVVKYAPGATLGKFLYGGIVTGPGYSYPTGLTVMPNGDVFLTDGFANDPSLTGGGRIIKLTAPNFTATTLTAGRYATALSSDAAGNLYAVENSSTSYKLVKYTGAGGNSATLYGTLHTNGIYYPWGIAMVNPGKFFVLDGDDGTLGGALMKIVNKNANLSNLTSSVGTLSPAFSTNVTNYQVYVSNTTTGVTLTPTTTDAGATVLVNNMATTSGMASANIPLNVGDNAIQTKVTAADGETIKTYTTTITRLPTTAALLTSLKLSVGTLAPTFTGGTTGYTATVPYATTSITITPTLRDSLASVTVNGDAVVNKTPSNGITLAIGTNTITTVVTAVDGVTTKTYTVVVTRALAADANLSGLALSTGPVSPGFAPSITSYTAAVSNTITSVMVTPSVEDPNATIKVNGVTVNSDYASQAISLAVGNNTITTVVTAQDGTTTKTYTLVVNRLNTLAANLANLKPSVGTISPVFNANTTSYTTIVSNTTASITVTPTLRDSLATVTVNGVAVANKAGSQSIAVAVGNTVITTVVTAQDGVTTKTYTLTVTRLTTTAANLANLKTSKGTINPVFNANTTSYTLTLDTATTSITVTPTLRDSLATVTVNGMATVNKTPSGAIAIHSGINVINVVVTATDGVTTKTYTLTANLPNSSNANLAGLQPSAGKLAPTFASGTTSYTDIVSPTTSSITLTPTTSNGFATVTVNGTAVASGSASPAIALAVGNNTITTVVTAQNGVTTQTYTLVVNRLAATAVNLANLKTSAGAIVPVFNANTTNYTVSVANTTTSATVTPTLRDSLATVTVNNVAVANKAASQAIALAVGANVINVTVTAIDNVTTKTYTITITRATGGSGFARTNIPSTFDNQGPSGGGDGIAVHQGVSPNGDGLNDFLVIDGIAAYPDNSLSIMDRSGQLVFETKGYDNTSKIFEGRSNKNGKLQQAGTYFYSLEYKVGNETKHKTGYIILKY